MTFDDQIQSLQNRLKVKNTTNTYLNYKNFMSEINHRAKILTEFEN